ncbi:MAG: transporter, partial [Aliifodinibius sp.]|nr:transporter [Fodinibius sp.]NIV15846.1 transporter [Fodinibius sp.]NIY29756.1 transporter [Fodinibius sp.]
EPEPDVEPTWQEIEDPRISEQKPADPKWWRIAFSDPILDELIEVALKENLTLRSAGLRVLQSQQQLAIAIGEQYPQQQQITGLAGRGKEEGITS